MKTDDFDFDLPEDLIAQTPLLKRDYSRLLVLDRVSGEIEHKHFYDIVDLLDSNDVLVLNNTKVMPARIIGIKEETNAVIELLMLKDEGDFTYECLVKPAKRIKVGTIVKFSEKLSAQCVSKGDDGIANFKFVFDGIFLEILEELGDMPLPPYIHEKLIDKDRYQTVYAKELGSAAAPTAGLHFTKEILKKLEDKGVTIAYITLHVGLGTFRPVTVDDAHSHKMHSEFYQISKETADVLNKAKQDGKRIISVGTTTTRTLETVLLKNDVFIEDSGFTDIFIYPGFKFKAIDALFTNFHLPKSTLIMLVSALSSRDIILNAYNTAVLEQYRFFSFGDSMFIK